MKDITLKQSSYIHPKIPKWFEWWRCNTATACCNYCNNSNDGTCKIDGDVYHECGFCDCFTNEYIKTKEAGFKTCHTLRRESIRCATLPLTLRLDHKIDIDLSHNRRDEFLKELVNEAVPLLHSGSGALKILVNGRPEFLTAHNVRIALSGKVTTYRPLRNGIKNPVLLPLTVCYEVMSLLQSIAR